MTDDLVEGVWRWNTTGSRLGNFTDWGPGQPNDLNYRQDCATFTTFDATSAIHWNDDYCTAHLPLCEKNLSNSTAAPVMIIG